MNVLVIAAHPDDEALGAGASIHRLAKEGHNVSVCLASHKSVTREDGLRSKALVSNGILGVNKTFFGSFDCMRFKDARHHDLVKFIENAIRDTKPDVVITHHPSDVHQDHQILAECSLEAVRLPQRQTEELPAIRRVMFMEVPSSTDWNGGSDQFMPNAFIEVGDDDIAAKISAIGVYEAVIRREPHPRSRRAIEALATIRGARFGVRSAEAFQQVFGEAI